MDFGAAFAQSLKKSAALAAEAAQQLDFNKMAAEDDYIHTEDGNVERLERRRLPVEPSMDDTSTLSTHSSLLDRNRHPRFPPQEPTPRLPGRQKSRNLVPLKVDVPERQRKIPEDSLSSEDSDDDDDPIFALMKGQKPKSGNRDPDPAAPSTTNSSETEIKKHRFFEDLENRIALPPQEMPDGILSETTKANNHAPAEPSSRAPAGLPPWLSAAASALRLPRSQKKGSSSTSFSRPAFFRKKPEAERDELANVAVVSGAAVLDDTELEALAAFGKRQEQNYLVVLMEVIKQFPRELFILFTLFLGGFVYLFAKNRSWGI